MASQLIVGLITGGIVAGFVAVLSTLNWWLLCKARTITSVADGSLVNAIDRLLPQTQCGECSYTGCRPYARAITQGDAEINQCPPGGPETIRQLAELLGREILPLNPAHGVYRPFRLAVIDEYQCIGCTKCIQACPVDTILGAAKQMHTVILQHCTGCELCIPPCPVDCIEMISAEDNDLRAGPNHPVHHEKAA